MKRSVVIAAFQNPGKIEENLRRLEGFEVILAVDDPSSELNEIIRKYDVKATVSDRRRGKWRALNDASELAEGDYILFLDSDTVVLDPGNPDGFDGVEVRKEINSSSMLGKLVEIDYFNMHIISLLASKLGTCLGFNGAAFWIKKEVFREIGGFRRRINEDTDLGVRLGINGHSYGVCGRAMTEHPRNFKEWLSQRERWALGGAEVITENFWKILKKPIMWVPALFLMFPALIGLVINMILPDSLLLKILYFLMVPFGFVSGKVIVILMYLLYGYHLLKNILAGLITFAIWASLMATLSKLTDYSIDLKYLPVYYFIYSPVWMFVALAALVKYLIFRMLGKTVRISNWKV